MRAWRIEAHGGPESVKCLELPTPEPGPQEVRVRVRAFGLNHMDLWVRKGVPGHTFPLPLIPGCDIAGEVDSLGPDSEKLFKSAGFMGLKIGSRVIVNPTLSCGVCESCLRGLQPICRSFGMLGEHRDGGAADFVVVPASNIIPLPDAISFEAAAALAVPFVTAWTMLVEKAKVRAGETVLIQAGGSGVSVAAIQIAKLLGAVVVTTVGSESKIEGAKKLGADFVINYKVGPFREQLKAWLKARSVAGVGDAGVDVVIEHVGGVTFEESLKVLNWGGRLVLCGATSGADVKVNLKPLFFKNISILGSTMGSKADLFRIVKLVEQKKLIPVIDSVYEFSDYLKATERLESREAFGKVIVKKGTVVI